MLSEKSWRPDLVLRLLMGLFASMMLGILIVSGYKSLVGDMGEKQWDLAIFIIGVFSFHGVGLVLVDVFVRQHNISWSEAFGFRDVRWTRTVWLALVVGVITLPVAWSLNELSTRFLRLLEMPIEPQTAVRVVQNVASKGHLIFHGIMTVLLAPFVEEVIFRGILYPAVKAHGNRKLALWGTSLFFALIHGSPQIVLPLTVLSIMLIFLYETTNNLAAPIITHSFFNAVNFGQMLWMLHRQGTI